MQNYDYVIVGAGSAGCVLAARLTEDPDVTVLLLEAGGRNDGMLVRMPAGVGALLKSRNASNWGFTTEPEPHLDGRRLWWPRGKGLGGSSAINGMVYTRGHPQDYDEWRQMGLTGWSFDDVLPYFRRLEGHHRGESDLHGGAGPLTISRGESDSPFHDALIAAGKKDAQMGRGQDRDRGDGRRRPHAARRDRERCRPVDRHDFSGRHQPSRHAARWRGAGAYGQGDVPRRVALR